VRKLVIVLIIAVLGLVVAYNIAAETRAYNFARMGWEHRRLDNARAKWDANGYTSYVMEVNAVTNHCLYDLGQTYSVLVIDDRVISTHRTDAPETEYGVTYCQGRTVIEVFRYIDHVISDLDLLRVEYDETLGYPTKFFTDVRGAEDASFHREVIRLTDDLDAYADQQKREDLMERRQ
jgi:hypothetical protein